MKPAEFSIAPPHPAARVWFNKCFSSVHGVLRQLRADWGNGLFLLGSHTDPDFAPLAECDATVLEPTGMAEAEYVDWCLDLCLRQRIDVFIPGRMREAISDRRAEFEARGTRLVVAGDGDTLRLLEDKGRFLQSLPAGIRAHRFERVRTWEEFAAACEVLEKAGLPACFKPAVATFGAGFYVIDDRLSPLKRLLRSETHRISKAELRSVLESAGKFPELLVMDYLGGSEFSVDTLAENGEVVAMVCRRKPMNGTVRIAGTSRTEHVHDGQCQVLAREPEIEEMVRILTRHFHLGGLFNVQFRCRAERPERPCLLEINGRMSGGLPYVSLCGLNLPLLAIRLAMRPPGTPLPEIPPPNLPLRVRDRAEVFIMPPVVPLPPPTEWRSETPGVLLARLPGGNFRLSLDREDIPFRDLCDLALRNNARRRFLFVSRTLGRHWPTRPAELRQVAAGLARKLAARLQPGPVVFIGMAETATTLGQAVFREFLQLGGSGLYIESTRRSTGGERAFEFAESHSHATAHVIHLPSPADDPDNLLRTAAQVVVVDDEATTAKTAAGLVREMRACVARMARISTRFSPSSCAGNKAVPTTPPLPASTRCWRGISNSRPTATSPTRRPPATASTSAPRSAVARATARATRRNSRRSGIPPSAPAKKFSSSATANSASNRSSWPKLLNLKARNAGSKPPPARPSSPAEPSPTSANSTPSPAKAMPSFSTTSRTTTATTV